MDQSWTKDAISETLPQSTSFGPWKVSKLVDAILRRGDRHIVIPTFQRSFIWNKKQRADLIESIRSGYPIGCLLLYHAGFEGNVQKLRLVDGLQRSVTLLKYTTDVFSYSTDLKLDHTLFRPLIAKYRTTCEGALRSENQVMTSLHSWL